MLHSGSISSGSPVQANVGLTAFQVAVAQVKVFERTLKDVADRQERVADEQAEKSEAQRQKVRQQIAEARGGVDVVVERPENAPAENPAPVTNANGQNNQDNKVDLVV